MKWISIAALLTASGLAAAPADFAGTWNVKYVGAPRTGPKTIGSMILALKVDGDRVTGIVHIGSWPGIAPISDGVVTDDQISFTARGYLSSTTGIPTCLLEGTLRGGELVIHLSTIQNPGGPGSGGIWDYRGGKVDDTAARAAQIEALTFLSRPRRDFPGYAEPNVVDPLTPAQLAARPVLDADRAEQARKLSSMVAQWEKAKSGDAQAFADGLGARELDSLVVFYSSPLGQSLVATTPHGDAEIQTTMAQFIGQR